MPPSSLQGEGETGNRSRGWPGPCIYGASRITLSACLLPNQKQVSIRPALPCPLRGAFRLPAQLHFEAVVGLQQQRDALFQQGDFMLFVQRDGSGGNDGTGQQEHRDAECQGGFVCHGGANGFVIYTWVKSTPLSCRGGRVNPGLQRGGFSVVDLPPCCSSTPPGINIINIL